LRYVLVNNRAEGNAPLTADRSGFEVLLDLVPLARRPNVAVIILSRLTARGLWELARQNGAIACFVKQHMECDALDRAIQNAVALVGLLPKEDRYRTL
jgi:DNA-binding NarL/FixJ family response regulator